MNLDLTNMIPDRTISKFLTQFLLRILWAHIHTTTLFDLHPALWEFTVHTYSPLTQES